LRLRAAGFAARRGVVFAARAGFFAEVRFFAGFFAAARLGAARLAAARFAGARFFATGLAIAAIGSVWQTASMLWPFGSITNAP
jgi:hypothetical protein